LGAVKFTSTVSHLRGQDQPRHIPTLDKQKALTQYK